MICTLTHLTLGLNYPPYDFFNQSLDNLPQKLTHLTLGFSFNHPITSLPKTLTHLIFGINENCHTYIRFAHSLSYLPSSLAYIEFQGQIAPENILLVGKIPPFVACVVGLRGEMRELVSEQSHLRKKLRAK